MSSRQPSRVSCLPTPPGAAMRSRSAAAAALLASLVVVAPVAAAPGSGSTSIAGKRWDPTLPRATYKTVSVYTSISMDDRTELGATITFPSKDGTTRAPGQFPVVFSMTPYGRDGVCGCPDQTVY